MSNSARLFDVGSVVGTYLILARAPNIGDSPAWFVQCVKCGRSNLQARTSAVQRNKSCGCIQTQLRHGHTKRGPRSGTYISWRSMKRRTGYGHCEAEQSYTGIVVCERWLKFDHFLADMGERPPGHSLDRIDSAGHYEPGNCRWATNAAQSRNKRTNHLIEFRGETLCLTDWAKRLGVAVNTIRYRLESGHSLEFALTAPAHSYRAPSRTRIGEDAKEQG